MIKIQYDVMRLGYRISYGQHFLLVLDTNQTVKESRAFTFLMEIHTPTDFGWSTVSSTSVAVQYFYEIAAMLGLSKTESFVRGSVMA